jgi:hypothetical protein
MKETKWGNIWHRLRLKDTERTCKYVEETVADSRKRVDFYVRLQTEKLTVKASHKRQRERAVTINKHKETRIKLRGKSFREIAKDP